jgi:hypothetical protein
MTFDFMKSHTRFQVSAPAIVTLGCDYGSAEGVCMRFNLVLFVLVLVLVLQIRFISGTWDEDEYEYEDEDDDEVCTL